MRISDWSSDVCSSDLLLRVLVHELGGGLARGGEQAAADQGEAFGREVRRPERGAQALGQPGAAMALLGGGDLDRMAALDGEELGSASCRARVCPVRVDLGGRRNCQKKNKKDKK